MYVLNSIIFGTGCFSFRNIIKDGKGVKSNFENGFANFQIWSCYNHNPSFSSLNFSRKFKFQSSFSLRKIERNRSGIKLKHTELPYLGMDSTLAPNWFLSCFSISFASSVSLISIEGSSKRLAKSPVSGLKEESVVKF